MMLPDMETVSENHLPTLNYEQRKISQLLSARIRKDIEQHKGIISFDRFMTHALYDQSYGYYQNGSAKFGVQGDFITAPEISSLYSFTLARQIEEICNAKLPDVLELGAGSGVMARDILLALAEANALPETYYIHEPCPQLVRRQQQTIASLPEELRQKVSWLDDLQGVSLSGVIIANEVMDALPFRQFTFSQGQEYELCVACDTEQFIWQQVESGTRLLNDLNLENARRELNTGLEQWLSGLTKLLHAGVILLLDYGESESDLLRKENGTMRCYYRQFLHDNPFVNIGFQDITSDVNFTQVLELAQTQNLSLLGYTTQTAFLMGNGIDQVFQTYHEQMNMQHGEVESINLIQAFKNLMMPNEMGERFKAIAFGKAYDQPLQGFAIKDLEYQL